MIGYVLAAACDIPRRDAWLTVAERRVVEGLRVPKRRGEWLLGRWAAKRAVAAALRLPLRAVEIRAGGDGAPEAWAGELPLRLTCSLSHSNGLAACLVSVPSAPVGCDLELVERRPAPFIADWFTRDERRVFEHAAPVDAETLVTAYWSAKESALKALRTGLRRDTRSVVVHPTAGGRDGWHRLLITDTVCGGRFDGWWRREGALVFSAAATALDAPPELLEARSAGGAPALAAGDTPAFAAGDAPALAARMPSA